MNAVGVNPNHLSEGDALGRGATSSRILIISIESRVGVELGGGRGGVGADVRI